MSEATLKSDANNAQNVFAKLSSLKREAYTNLDQALALDASQTSVTKNFTENVIDLYEKSMKSIERAMFFYQQHKKELSSIEGNLK